MINFVYLDKRKSFGFFARKFYGNTVEIWVADENGSRLLLKRTDQYAISDLPLSFQFSVIQRGQSDYYGFLFFSRDILNASSYVAETVDSKGISIAKRIVFNSSPDENVLSFSPVIRGLWPILTEPPGGIFGNEFTEVKDLFFNQVQTLFRLNNLTFYIPLPAVAFRSDSSEYALLETLGVIAFIPNPDYTGALAFDFNRPPGSSVIESKPVAWVDSNAQVTLLSGGVFGDEKGSLASINDMEIASSWIVTFPYAYRLAQFPSVLDPTIQNRLFEKWQINLQSGTITLLGTISTPLSGFNDPDLEFCAWSLPADLLLSLPVTP